MVGGVSVFQTKTLHNNLIEIHLTSLTSLRNIPKLYKD
jgi:hypothetical protein